MSIVRLDIHVDNPNDIAVLYDLIQVWRSPNEGGSPIPYAQITSQEATKASLVGTVEGPWNLNGTSLTVVLDGGTSRTIQFSGSNPINLIDVLTAINQALPGIASESGEDTNLLRFTSPTFGTRSSLSLSGSAASLLGLSIDKTNGKGASPLLAQTTEEYEFVDYDGAEDYWYRTRFSNSQTGAVSDFSPEKRGAIPDVIPPSNLLRCFLYLADGTGSPIVNRRIILVSTQQVHVTNDDAQVYGILPSVDRIVLVTDDAGYAEEHLIRGQTFKIFIEGTPFQREVTIPTIGPDLNLLTAASTAPDPFTVVSVPPRPVRMS